jgi:Domain of unknown function (DUF4406)
MKLYLAGPMRGYDDNNFPAFHKYATVLRAMGHTVFSPAEKDEEKFGGAAFQGKVAIQATKAAAVGFDLRKALQMDLDYICSEADGVALLKGWECSKGACAESATANALGLPRFIQTMDDLWQEINSDGSDQDHYLGPISPIGDQ